MASVMIYSFFDKKQGCYLPPLSMNNRGAAIRMFMDMVNVSNDQSVIYRYPGDFDLYEIGEFDLDSGQLIFDKPEYICNGTSLREDFRSEA